MHEPTDSPNSFCRGAHIDVQTTVRVFPLITQVLAEFCLILVSGRLVAEAVLQAVGSSSAASRTREMLPMYWLRLAAEALFRPGHSNRHRMLSSKALATQKRQSEKSHQ